MLFHRLSEKLGSQNWVAACVDLVIVVLGIFLGLQASQWYEGRQELILEKSILIRLQSEFGDIADEIDAGIEFHQHEILALELILLSVQRGKLLPTDEDLFYSGLRGAMNYELGPGRSSTYVEILSSGQFRLLRDEALRDSLARYDDFVTKTDSLFSNFQSFQRKYEIPLYRHVVRGSVQRKKVAHISSGEVYLHGDIAEIDFDAMTQDEEFIEAIRRLMEFHINFQIWLAQTARWANKVSDAMRPTSL